MRLAPRSLAWLTAAYLTAASGLAENPTRDAMPIFDAPVDVQLLGRSVAAVRSPCGAATGFLVCEDTLLTAPDVVAGVAPDEIAVWFDEWGAAQPRRDAWPVREVVLLPADGKPQCALLSLAPRAGAPAGKLYGYLGIRRDDPDAGEPLRVLAYDENGREKSVSRDHLLPRSVDATLLEAGGIFDRAGGAPRPGAPLLDGGGCVVAIDVGTHAISGNQLRAWMPASGSALCECQLPIEANDWYDQGGGRMSAAAGGGGGRITPLIGLTSRRGGGGPAAASIPGSRPIGEPDLTRTADQSVFNSADPLPEPTPGEPLLEPPARDRDQPPDRARRPKNKTPGDDEDDPRHDPPRQIPEPGTAIMLGLGALAFIPRRPPARRAPR